VIIPKALDNVFVTTAVSSTHVSFGTYRLEPVRMAFGQAAAIAAQLCIRYGLAGKDVPARQIQDELLPTFSNPYGDTNVLLTYLSDVKPNNPHYLAIQYLAARGLRPKGETFKPEAPTTRGELVEWLTLLARRAAPEPKVVAKSSGGTEVVERAFVPYMGLPCDHKALAELGAIGNLDAPATRAEIAYWLTKVLPRPAGPSRRRYSDIGSLSPENQAAINRLGALGTDSILWDSWTAFAPDGTLLFRPNDPLRHDDMFATLYLAQIGLGPSFYDHPMDGGKGRAVPPGIFERVMR
jgi:hypothetical protein